MGTMGNTALKLESLPEHVKHKTTGLIGKVNEYVPSAGTGATYAVIVTTGKTKSLKFWSVDEVEIAVPPTASQIADAVYGNPATKAKKEKSPKVIPSKDIPTPSPSPILEEGSIPPEPAKVLPKYRVFRMDLPEMESKLNLYYSEGYVIKQMLEVARLVVMELPG